MALTDFHIESLKGIGPIPPKQGILEESSTQMAALGQGLVMNDGRRFHYALNGAAALSPGKLIQSKASPANALNKNVLAAAVGAYTVTVVSDAAITDAAEGYLTVNDGTGEGQMLKIKTSAANASTATSTDCVLYDPVNVALVAGGTSQAMISYNPWDDVVIQDGDTNGITFCCGVPIIPVQAAYYFWCQTWGLAPIWQGGTNVIGSMVAQDVENAGAATLQASGSVEQVYGVTYGAVGVDTEYRVTYLTICP